MQWKLACNIEEKVQNDKYLFKIGKESRVHCANLIRKNLKMHLESAKIFRKTKLWIAAAGDV